MACNVDWRTHHEPGCLECETGCLLQDALGRTALRADSQVEPSIHGLELPLDVLGPEVEVDKELVLDIDSWGNHEYELRRVHSDPYIQLTSAEVQKFTTPSAHGWFGDKARPGLVSFFLEATCVYLQRCCVCPSRG